jgi:AraC family transcriptional regulator
MLESSTPTRVEIATAMPVGRGEACSFSADILLKRTSRWVGGKYVVLDRRPLGTRTEFTHRLSRHTLALHLEGANTQAALRYDGGAPVRIGSTLGQVMLIPAGHRLEGWSDYPPQIRHVLLLLDPVLIGAEAQEDARLDKLEVPYRVDLADGIIASRMRALQTELDNPGLMGRLYADCLGSEIAVRIVRRHSTKAAPPARGGLTHRRLRRVQDYIEANLSGEITLADLAALAGVSNTHFCRAFHKSVGLASHQYVIRRRVERAKQLLAQSELPIAEIAVAVGFGDQSHLTSHFRRLVGTTPWRFRNQI